MNKFNAVIKVMQGDACCHAVQHPNAVATAWYLRPCVRQDLKLFI